MKENSTTRNCKTGKQENSSKTTAVNLDQMAHLVNMTGEMIGWTAQVQRLFKSMDTLDLTRLFKFQGIEAFTYDIAERSEIIFIDSMNIFVTDYKRLAVEFTQNIRPLMDAKWLYINTHSHVCRIFHLLSDAGDEYNEFVHAFLTFTAHKQLYDIILQKLSSTIRAEHNRWKPSMFVENTWAEMQMLTIG